MAYEIEFAPGVERHLRALGASEQRIVLAGIETHLVHQPQQEARNQKPMRPNPLAAWGLRLGDLRIYHRVEDDVVQIAAVGTKRGNEVWVGEEKVET